MNDFLDVVKNKYADFNGRARRREYWMYILFYSIGLVALSIVISILAGILGMPFLIFLVYLYPLALLVPTLAISVRRLHDIDKDWVWILVNFIPFIGGIWFLIMTIQEGTRGDNQFGPDPKAGEALA